MVFGLKRFKKPLTGRFYFVTVFSDDIFNTFYYYLSKKDISTKKGIYIKSTTVKDIYLT